MPNAGPLGIGRAKMMLLQRCVQWAFEHEDVLMSAKKPATAELTERAAEERKAAEDQACAGKLAKRSTTNEVERAEIEKARKRTKARAPRIAIHIEDRGTAGRALCPDHSDEEGHRYRLADTFGTRSLQFVYSMLKGL